MSTETQTGTIHDTELYKNFHKYVVEKFESVGNFSMIATGKRNTFNCIERKIDKRQSRVIIIDLHDKARILKYVKSKVFISEQERLAIKYKVYEIVQTQGITKIQYFRDIHISINIYKQIVSGLNPYKNQSYQKLTKILFE